MTTTTIRQGRPTADRLAPDLTPAEQITIMARALYRRGYDDHLAGHITVRHDDGTLWCNPWFLLWDEFGPEDVIRIDLDGNVVEGNWPVPPGIPLHLALHRIREDITVAVHNHAQWSTTWANRRQAPEIFDQTGALTAAKVAIVDEYEGGVNDLDLASRAVYAMGDARIGLLAGHGVFVLGDNVPEVFLRCASFEWRCRRALELDVRGDARPLHDHVALGVGEAVDTKGFPGYWEAAIRRELRDDPTLLGAE